MSKADEMKLCNGIIVLPLIDIEFPNRLKQE